MRKCLFLLLISTSISIFYSCSGSTKETNEKESRVSKLPYYTEASFTPQWYTNQDSIRNIHAIGNFSLINQLGEKVTEGTFTDKIYVSDFFFTTCPGICPKMTNNMKRVQEAFKNDDEVLLISHSVTPQYDTPEILNAYAKRNEVIPEKWHLVTGNRDHIYDMGRNQYFVEEDLGLKKGKDEFLHTENFILVDKNKHIRGIYNGLNKTSINQLIADIKTLKKED